MAVLNDLARRIARKLALPSFLWWNHNDYYHAFLLRQLPPDAKRALDVGCGTGRFARLLARRVEHVDAIDRYKPAIEEARRLSSDVHYSVSDLFDFEGREYDFISCIAALHHMTLEDALVRLRSMLRPGGTLVVLGIPAYGGFEFSGALAFGVNAVIGAWYAVRRKVRPSTRVSSGDDGACVPILEPDLTEAQFRAEVGRILPGSEVRHLFFFRYALISRHV